MDKSYVTMEQKHCIVCMNVYDTGNLLLDERLTKRFDRGLITGVGSFCPECQKKIDEGYVCLIEVDPNKTEDTANPYRTGEILFLRKEAAQQIFTDWKESPISYIEQKVTEKIKSMVGYIDEKH